MSNKDVQDTDSRLVILEYRQDKTDESLHNLRVEYTEEHAALRKSLQGIERNLSTIKYVSMGAVFGFLAQILGFTEIISILKTLL